MVVVAAFGDLVDQLNIRRIELHAKARPLSWVEFAIFEIQVVVVEVVGLRCGIAQYLCEHKARGCPKRMHNGGC